MTEGTGPWGTGGAGDRAERGGPGGGRGRGRKDKKANAGPNRPRELDKSTVASVDGPPKTQDLEEYLKSTFDSAVAMARDPKTPAEEKPHMFSVSIPPTQISPTICFGSLHLPTPGAGGHRQ